ncbi:MAG: hypothetical protein JKY53_03815 [Flavobacteriales bacterium]|nr:hypothetical protein [Flavobacteriales bacterium]
MSIAVVNFLDEKLLKHIIKRGFSKIQYLKKSAIIDVNLFNDIEFIDGSNFTKIHWDLYNDLFSQLEKISTELPSFFEYKGINLKDAVLKDLLWECLNDYCVTHAKKISNRDEDYLIIDTPPSKLFFLVKIILKWLKSLIYLPSKALNINSESIKNKILVNANNKTKIDLFKDVYRILGGQKITIISTEGQGDFKSYANQNYDVKYFSINPRRTRSLSLLKQLRCLPLVNIELLYKIFSVRNNLCEYVATYEKLFSMNPYAIIDIAGENNGKGTIISLIGKKYDVISFNYMNGAKAKEPYNLGTCFDYWFMPDEETKNMLMSYTMLDENQLPVIGHMNEDRMMNFIPKNLLAQFKSNYLDKKIITVYSSPLFRDEFYEVINTINKEIDSDKYIVFVKYHPLDETTLKNIPSYFVQLPLDEDITKNVMFLYELYYYSHVNISFTSTVCKEASLFKGTSINYECREISELPFVSSIKDIIHVKNKNHLKIILDDLLNDKTPLEHGIKVVPTQLVAERMANFILKR